MKELEKMGSFRPVAFVPKAQTLPHKERFDCKNGRTEYSGDFTRKAYTGGYRQRDEDLVFGVFHVGNRAESPARRKGRV